jgi:hypothetical protein
MSGTSSARRRTTCLSREQERARAERDARYRANTACAVKQLRALVAMILTVSTLTLGWPTAPIALVQGAAQPHLDADGQARLVGPLVSGAYAE